MQECAAVRMTDSQHGMAPYAGWPFLLTLSRGYELRLVRQCVVLFEHSLRLITRRRCFLKSTLGVTTCLSSVSGLIPLSHICVCFGGDARLYSPRRAPRIVSSSSPREKWCAAQEFRVLPRPLIGEGLGLVSGIKRRPRDVFSGCTGARLRQPTCTNMQGNSLPMTSKGKLPSPTAQKRVDVADNVALGTFGSG